MTDQKRRERRQDALLSALRTAGRPAGVQELLQRAGLHAGDQTEAKRILRDLVRDGTATREGKRYSMAGAAGGVGGAAAGAAGQPSRAGKRSDGGGRSDGVLGTLTRHRDGFGFVARLDRKGEDIFLPPGEATRALDGDVVRVEVVAGRGGRSAGRLLEVVERRRRFLIGTYRSGRRGAAVVPIDVTLGFEVPVPDSKLAAEGDVVKVALAPGTGPLAGEVVEVIGRPGEPRVEVLGVAYAKGFADVFPEAVLADAERVPDHVRPEDRAGRRDLTALPLVTIDGEDARDFDDAVYLERLPEGKAGAAWRLVVAIADVSHYVQQGSALDDEALRRGTSVYFPMQVLPMLPERLSNGICSLNPDVERLCMVADMIIGPRGEPKGVEVYQAVMKSAARCTYTEVAQVLDGQSVPHRERFRPQFTLMGELQEQLTAMRRRRGAIDFDLPEAKILVDEAGHVSGIEKRPRNRAHRVVEEFMLAANEAVALWFSARELPTIYRIHGTPDEEKLRAFVELAEAHGFAVPAGALDPRALDELLTRLQGHAQQRALNQLLLRAMMQAVYSPEDSGHFGLAADHYLHFTSPIRRYPDLVVHRLLREEWARREGHGARRTSEEELGELASRSSERERAAMEGEREIAAYYAALFMKDKVGERYPGNVAAVAEPGLFVELTPFFVEGLVRAETLPGMFDLDPVHHALVDRGTGRAFRVGDPVEVQVADVSIERRRIDLALVSEMPKSDPALQGAARPPGRKRLLDGGAGGGRGGKAGAGRPGGGRPGGRSAAPKGSGGAKPGGAKKGGTPGRGGKNGRPGGGKSSRGGGRRGRH
jgi:ribonuclease R